MAQVDINPSNDAYTDVDYPTTNYGSTTNMMMCEQTGWERRMFLKFNISPIPRNAIITSAILYVYAYSSKYWNMGSRLYDVTSNWSEGTITWNTMPTVGSQQTTKEIVSANYQNYTITTLFNKWLKYEQTNYGVRITHDVVEDNYCFFYSKETATYKPYLRIIYTTPILEGSISFVGAVSKKQFRTLTGAISFIGSLSISKIYKKLLEGGISFIGTLSRKVSYKRLQEGAISFIGTLQRKLSLHRLLEGSISFIGTLLGSRLFKKTLEGAISFIGTLSRTRTYRRTLEGIISFVGKLKVTKLWRAVSKMSNIWTPEDKRSNVWTPQDKRDNDWIEE